MHVCTFSMDALLNGSVCITFRASSRTVKLSSSSRAAFFCVSEQVDREEEQLLLKAAEGKSFKLLPFTKREKERTKSRRGTFLARGAARRSFPTMRSRIFSLCRRRRKRESKVKNGAASLGGDLLFNLGTGVYVLTLVSKAASHCPMPPPPPLMHFGRQLAGNDS